MAGEDPGSGRECVREGEPADLFSNLESMHLRQVEIEQNQIRLLLGLLNGFNPSAASMVWNSARR